MAPGRFITFEGGEGAGKSTQATLLADALRAAGRAVVQTREPGGTPAAESIRALVVAGEPGRWDAMTEAMLHTAARREHVERLIRPRLAAGAWVVCDRFVDSTLAYQGYGHGLGRDVVLALHRLAIGGLMPDLTLVLDLPVEDGLQRAGRKAGEDRYERMERGFHTRLREGFLAIARDEPARCVVIDARAGVADVQRAVAAAVSSRFGVALAAPPA